MRQLGCIALGLALAVASGCRTNVVRLPAGDIVVSETKVYGPESSGLVFRGASDGSTRITAALPLTDWQKRDFRLKKDSPAFKLGFKPFDPSLAGRRTK